LLENKYLEKRLFSFVRKCNINNDLFAIKD